MSLKNIIKVANYYNVKYSFEATTRVDDYTIVSCVEDEDKNLDFIRKGKINSAYNYIVTVEFTGLFKGKPFTFVESYPYYLELNDPRLELERFVDIKEGGDPISSKLLLDDEELTTKSEEFEEFVGDEIIGQSMFEIMESREFKSALRRCDAIDSGISNIGSE